MRDARSDATVWSGTLSLRHTAGAAGEGVYGGDNSGEEVHVCDFGSLQDPGTYRVHVPAELDVAGIRKGLGLTQAAFAARYRFPIGTLRDLEQGRARPDASTRAYLTVISREPEAVQRALAPAA